MDSSTRVQILVDSVLDSHRVSTLGINMDPIIQPKYD